MVLNLESLEKFAISKRRINNNKKYEEWWYPVIAGGQKPSFYCNQYNRNGEFITVAGSGAYAGCVNYYNGKIMCTDCFTISSINKNLILNKFIYQFLLSIQDDIYLKKEEQGFHTFI